ncbi:cyclopropane-fatty-acyl-phospholipid synthase family protein [Haladaptatus sp. DYSN1]|uniref:SAM-dependent methyltransferase n=1 Tax=unclassified Haladaptatus TaxID=2622732 RepID=UPI0024051E74|nr:class I SAM-dependent methyltransferase [Haladaptatus sp. DYSN1]
MDFETCEARYEQEEYYWGTEPNDLARKTASLVSTANTTPTVIDIGAGEGRDVVYFAKQGFDAYATDVSPNGLEKARQLAAAHGVAIETLEADANELALPEPVDVVYSCGAIQYIQPENRDAQFQHFQEMTNPGGIHTMFAFVDHPAVPTAPDWTENEYFYEQGEFESYYSSWNVLERDTLIFENESGGESHQHAAEIVIAKNPTA